MSDRDTLTTSKGRTTRQRAAIAKVLTEAGGFLTAQELFDRLRERGHKIGLATVYRNLQSLAEKGEVDALRRPDGDLSYRQCETDEHHHHFVCRRCGFSVELANEDLEVWAKAAGGKYGFSDITHDLELFGICERCSTR